MRERGQESIEEALLLSPATSSFPKPLCNNLLKGPPQPIAFLLEPLTPSFLKRRVQASLYISKAGLKPLIPHPKCRVIDQHRRGPILPPLFAACVATQRNPPTLTGYCTWTEPLQVNINKAATLYQASIIYSKCFVYELKLILTQ